MIVVLTPIAKASNMSRMRPLTDVYLARLEKIAAAATHAAAFETAQRGMPVAESVDGIAVATPPGEWLAKHTKVSHARKAA